MSETNVNDITDPPKPKRTASKRTSKRTTEKASARRSKADMVGVTTAEPLTAAEEKANEKLPQPVAAPGTVGASATNPALMSNLPPEQSGVHAPPAQLAIERDSQGRRKGEPPPGGEPAQN